jgi:hypothetical protein
MYKTIHIFTDAGRENFLRVVNGVRNVGFEFASAKPFETKVRLQVTMLAKYCGTADDMAALNDAVKKLPHGTRIILDEHLFH